MNTNKNEIILEKFLKEALGSIYSNYVKFNITQIRNDQQIAINEVLQQRADFINFIEFNKPGKSQKVLPGLKLTTATEIIEYTHHPELDMRSIVKKPF
jgi:hypothetical protein